MIPEVVNFKHNIPGVYLEDYVDSQGNKFDLYFCTQPIVAMFAGGKFVFVQTGPSILARYGDGPKDFLYGTNGKIPMFAEGINRAKQKGLLS